MPAQFDDIIDAYRIFNSINSKLQGYSAITIQQRVKALNNYYNFLHSNNLDNIFSAQSKFRPTILEEFMYILFRDYVAELKETYNDDNDCLNCGSVKAYSNLFFTSTDVQQFVTAPQIKINQKDQDYAIYRSIGIVTSDNVEATVNLPIVAIENKTYIDKTMLDSVMAAAEKVKQGNPYTYFCIVTETYDVDFNVDPCYSELDQIYVLRKSKRVKNSLTLPQIDYKVVIKLFNDIKTHIEKPWSNVQEKMLNEGVII